MRKTILVVILLLFFVNLSPQEGMGNYENSIVKRTSSPRSPKNPIRQIWNANLVDIFSIQCGGTGQYHYGLTYDWDNNSLWITIWDHTLLDKMYEIETQGPENIIGSFTYPIGFPEWDRVGIAYCGGNKMLMTSLQDFHIYKIDMNTSTWENYREDCPAEDVGLAYDVNDNVLYQCNWHEAYYASPSETGPWTMWHNFTDASCGIGCSYNANETSPYIFVVTQDVQQAHIYQFENTNGIPHVLLEIYGLPSSMTQEYTGDCAFVKVQLYSPPQVQFYSPLFLS